MTKMGISVDSSKEEEEEEEENSHYAMEIEGQFEEIPPQTEETREEPSTQVHQYQLQEGQPMQEEHPSQEGHPTWFLSILESSMQQWNR